MRTATWLAMILLAACGGSSTTSTTSTTTPTPRTDGAPAQPFAAPSTGDPPQQPPSTDPAGGDATFDETVAQVLVVFAAFGKAVDDAGPDCPRAAAALTAVLDDPRNQRVIAANQALTEDVALRGRLEEWTKAHMDELVEVLTKVQNTAARCEQDPGFRAFMTRFSAL